MLRLRALAGSLNNSDTSGRTRVREISSACPICVRFGILLDVSGHRCGRSPEFERKPDPLNDREFSRI
jgi:hypothetical protein